jgi:hypothetical protein
MAVLMGLGQIGGSASAWSDYLANKREYFSPGAIEALRNHLGLPGSK